MSKTALSRAMNGEKVSERQSKGALNQAVGRIANLKKRAAQSKEAMAETGAMVLHTAENQGSLFLASLAEGYLGTDKMKLGGVDVRAPAAILAQGYGLFEAMSGRRGGNHALAIGNGIMGSWLASVAVGAGQTLRKAPTKPAANPTTPAAVPVAPTTMQGVALLPEPAMHGPMREVLLTPEPQPVVIHGQDFQGRPPRRRHPRPDLEGEDFEGRRPPRRHRRTELEGGDFEGRHPRRRHPRPELEGDDFEGPRRPRPPRRRRIPSSETEDEEAIEGRRRGPRRGPSGGGRRGRRMAPRFRRNNRFVRPEFDDEEDEDIEDDE